MVVILTTVPSLSAGRKLARKLLDAKLAACVSILPNLESHYTWKNKREKAKECLCLIKTRRGLAKKAMASIAECHPYDVPEIAVLKAEAVNASYLAWMKSCVLPSS